MGIQSNKPRPLLTTLHTSSNVFEVIKVKQKLLGTASDQFTQQQQYFDVGKNNSFIKFFNNILTISLNKLATLSNIYVMYIIKMSEV